ncbi:MAG: YhjD/YihY/BrkB family envelope integrity protein [Ferruginibacter sp.]
MAKNIWKGIVQIFKDAGKGFGEHKLTKLSGSLAYSTVFSLGPLLIVIISLCSIFFAREAVEGKIYGQLAGFIGSQTATQLQQIIKSGHTNRQKPYCNYSGYSYTAIGINSSVWRKYKIP